MFCSFEKKQRQVDPETLGAVPLGVPLIAGPAVLTTSIVLAAGHGKIVTALALGANIGLTGIVFWFADPITDLIGAAGSKILSKIASLLLAAIAVMLVRKGVVEIVLQFRS